MNKFSKLYKKLKKQHGPQGWWPIEGKYHPANFSYPKNEKQKFEICIGAILAQNTAWKNVEKALQNLKKEKLFDANKVMYISQDSLASLIRPAGYFNQKAKKLIIFAEFYIKLDGNTPARENLLNIWGIGPETADSMLLYAYKVPTFVVDAYTRRILLGLKFIDEKSNYMDIKYLFEKNLPKDFKIYQEFHALLVEHAKRSSN